MLVRRMNCPTRMHSFGSRNAYEWGVMTASVCSTPTAWVNRQRSDQAWQRRV